MLSQETPNQRRCPQRGRAQLRDTACNITSLVANLAEISAVHSDVMGLVINLSLHAANPFIQRYKKEMAS